MKERAELEPVRERGALHGINGNAFRHSGLRLDITSKSNLAAWLQVVAGGFMLSKQLICEAEGFMIQIHDSMESISRQTESVRYKNRD